MPSCRDLAIRAVPALLLTLAAPVRAADPLPEHPGDPVADLRAEIAALRADYEQRLAALEARLAALEGTVTAAAGTPPPAAPAPAPAAQTANYFNPAISVIGNFLGVAGSNDVAPLPVADLREVELGFQAVVDPYARADVFVSLGEEGAAVEEGYVTFTALPAQLLAKVGRLRAGFGKINTLHLHALPWPDEPLPIVNLLGGEEGWKGDGVSLARLLPIGDTFSELTLQAFRGDAEGLFAAPSREDLAYNAHYKLFRDLTDASNLELGASWAEGPNGTTDSARTRLAGLDLTYRWKPLRTATYRGLIVRGEWLRSDREQPEGHATGSGWFVSADAQLARRWWLGGRLESSARATDDRLRDDGGALALTFDPSEFLQLRSEFRQRRYAEDVTANELLLQLQFIIGAHGAHPF